MLLELKVYLVGLELLQRRRKRNISNSIFRDKVYTLKDINMHFFEDFIIILFFIFFCYKEIF